MYVLFNLYTFISIVFQSYDHPKNINLTFRLSRGDWEVAFFYLPTMEGRGLLNVL